MMQIINFSEKNIEQSFKIDSSQDYFLYCVGTGSANLTFDIVESNVRSNIYGVVIGDSSSKIKLKTVVKHVAANSESWFHLKGLFFNDATLDFEGMIDIGENASGSDAYLKNDNLVMGENAVVNSSPQLEIKNQDVKASHGVTIKTLEEYEAFYLKSRGLDQSLSNGLLIKGFVLDLIEKCSDEFVKRFIIDTLVKKL